MGVQGFVDQREHEVVMRRGGRKAEGTAEMSSWRDGGRVISAGGFFFGYCVTCS